MADLETALRTLVLQHPDVAAAFGIRFFWNHIPEGTITYPLIRAQTITEPFLDTHGGQYGGRSNVQLDVYDDDKATCNTSAETLKAWLHNYNGALGSYRVTIKVRNYPSFWEEEARLFRRILEIEILYMI